MLVGRQARREVSSDHNNLSSPLADAVEGKADRLTSHHDARQYQLSTLFVGTRTWLNRLVLFVRYYRFLGRNCWKEKKGEKKNRKSLMWQSSRVSELKRKDWELTYDLKVHITIPRWRKFKVNAASEIASVFLLNEGKIKEKKRRKKIDEVSKA